MSKKIPDFTDSQIWAAESTLAERFKKKIEVQVIDSEICLHPHDRELTPVSMSTMKSKTALSRCYACRPTMRARGHRKAKAPVEHLIIKPS
jgi:hypothetical protein